MHPNLNAELIQKALSQKGWDDGNRVLYKLCAENPWHKDDGIIIAKIWLIGRAYSAAIERRPKAFVHDSGDLFYEKYVAPKIRQSPIDEWLQWLIDDKGNSPELTLKVHKNLTGLFSRISGLEKRSLASKYLHFHFPERYYIYDALASAALVSISEKQKGPRTSPINESDTAYAQFFVRCQKLNQILNRLAGQRITPRELDKFLLELNRRNKKQKAEPA
jgi:hypothetical protein